MYVIIDRINGYSFLFEVFGVQMITHHITELHNSYLSLYLNLVSTS